MLSTQSSRPSVGGFAFVSLGLTLLMGCAPSGPRSLQSGVRLLQQGQYARAIEKLKAASELLPQQAQVWNHLGLAYHGANQSENAIFSYQKALELNRDLAAARFNLGSLYLEQNNLKAAINELTTYSALQPMSPEGWRQLATAQLRDRQFDPAEKSLNNLLQLRPGEPAALNGLGLIQVQKKRPREAANLFNAATQGPSVYPPALLNLAVLSHQHLNNRPFALKKYQEYLALKPRPANWQAVRTITAQLESELNPPSQPRPAILTVQTQSVAVTNVQLQPRTNLPIKAPVTNLPVMVRAPTNPAPILTTAPPASATLSPPILVSNLSSEIPIKPAQEPKRELARVPRPQPPLIETNSPEVMPDAGPNEVSTKQPKGGLLDRVNPLNWRISKSSSAPRVTPLPSSGQPGPGSNTSSMLPTVAKTIPPSSGLPPPIPSPPLAGEARYQYRHPSRPRTGNRVEAERLFSEGVKAQREKRLARAIELYRNAIQTDPSFFDACYNLGLAHYQAGEWKQSLAIYETALALDPGSASARYNFALALQKASFVRDAADELTKLLAQSPGDTRVYLTLGNLYAKELNQPDLARELYLKLLQAEPRHAQATAIRYWLANHP